MVGIVVSAKDRKYKETARLSDNASVKSFVPSKVKGYSGGSGTGGGAKSVSPPLEKGYSGGSGEGTIVNPAGETVIIKNTPTPESATIERNKMLMSSNQLSEKQKKELEIIRENQVLNLSNKREIIIDKSGVDKINEDFKKAGINNAKDFFDKSRSGMIDVKDNNIYVKSFSKKDEDLINVNSNEEQNFFLAPKQKNISETQNVDSKKVFLTTDYKYQNELRLSNNSIGRSKLENAESKSKELFYQNIEKNRFNPGGELIYLSGSVFKGVQNVAFSVATGKIIPETIDFGKSLVTKPFETTLSVGERAISNPGEFGGEVLAFKGLTKSVSKVSPFKVEVVKDMNIPKSKTNLVVSENLEGGKNVYNFVESNEGKGIVSQIKITYPEFVSGKKTLGTPFKTNSVSFNTPKYNKFLSDNPLYKDFLNTEIITDLPDKELFDVKTIIVKENGKTVFKDVKTPKKDLQSRNIELDYNSDNSPNIPPSSSDGGGVSSDFNVKPLNINNPFSRIGNLGGKQNQVLLFEDEVLNTGVSSVKIKPFINNEITSVNSRFFVSPIFKSPVVQSPSIVSSFNVESKNNISNVDVINYKVVSSSNFKYNVSSSISSSSKVSLKNYVSQVESQSQNQSQKSFQSQNISSSLKLSQVQSQSQRQSQRSNQIQSQKIKLNNKLISPLINKSRDNSSFFVGGFDVLVKKRGVFTKINTGALSKSEAISYGSKVVDFGESASFKILPSKSFVTQKGTNSNSALPTLLSKFYKKNNLFVEKTSFRIDSPGELQGITFKGLNKLGSNRRLKKLYGGI